MRFLKKLLAIRRANKILAAETREKNKKIAAKQEEKKRFSFTCRICRQEFDTREVTPILLSHYSPGLGDVCSRKCHNNYWFGGYQ